MPSPTTRVVAPRRRSVLYYTQASHLNDPKIMPVFGYKFLDFWTRALSLRPCLTLSSQAPVVSSI